MSSPASKPLLIGLLGGVACGKSAVGRLLAELGATVVNADELGHQQLTDPAVIDQIVARWGRGVLDEAGQVNRRAVAARVFGKSAKAAEERKWLEAIIHPRVRAAMQAEIQQATSAGVRVVVVDVPLLIEAGWVEQCPIVLWIETPLAKRRELAAVRGWDADELDRREAAQLPLAAKRRQATHTIDNSGTLQQLGTRVREFWAEVVAE